MTLLGVLLLFTTIFFFGGLVYGGVFDNWPIWLGVGSAFLLVGGSILWQVSRILQDSAQQLQTPQISLPPEQFPESKFTPKEDMESTPTSSSIVKQPDIGRIDVTSLELETIRREVARLRQVETQLTQRNHELTILQSAGVAITSSLDLHYVLNTVVEQMTRLLEVECCTLFEWHPTEQMIRRIAKYDATGWWSAEALTSTRLLADYPVTKSVLEDQIPEQMTWSQPNLDPAEAAYMRQVNLKTRMLLPMMFQQQVIGLVELEDSQRERIFNPSEISLVKLLANQAGSAIENARLYHQAKQEIAERQQAEKALEAERALLAQRVKERTAELSEVNVELARVARLKDEFLANMSHELRTPLNVIMGSAELLDHETFGDLNERQKKYANNIYESGRHLLALITDILDLSKIEAGKLELEADLVSVEGVCEATLRLVKQLAHKKEQTISLDIEPNVTMLSADERRLKQILVNLLSNAIKFTPSGGQVGLEIRGDADKEVIRFTVWDTGIGIAPADLKKLFQPFVQIDSSSLTRHQEGTGLGLSLVSRLTELHNGGISVESEVGVGSRFTVLLPWSPAIEVETSAPINEPALRNRLVQRELQPTASSPLLLIADDNEKNISMLLDFLQAQGYRIALAQNGHEAIEQARIERPDLILMDVHMPGMDGLEATRRLRADKSLRQVPIIATTALAMPNDRERCLNAGANDYISKPIRLITLINTIETYLNKNQEK